VHVQKLNLMIARLVEAWAPGLNDGIVRIKGAKS
jgi:hypothetical protein